MSRFRDICIFLLGLSVPLLAHGLFSAAELAFAGAPRAGWRDFAAVGAQLAGTLVIVAICYSVVRHRTRPSVYALAAVPLLVWIVVLVR